MGWDVTITAPDGSKEYADHGREHGRNFDLLSGLRSEDAESQEFPADMVVRMLGSIVAEGLHESGNPWLGDIKLLQFVLNWLTDHHEANQPTPVFTIKVSS